MERSTLRPTVSYHLFMYRAELGRRDSRPIRLSKTKIEITDELITQTVRNHKTCSLDDLKAASRQTKFKRKLRHLVSKLKKAARQSIQN